MLESLAGAGVTHAPKPRRKPAVEIGPTGEPKTSAAATPRSGKSTPYAATPSTSAAVRPSNAPSELFPLIPQLSPAGRADTWEILQSEVKACTRCSELASTRTQTVFGVGNRRPRLCFMGEAPGADEDKQGEPFVGAAGKLLNKILEACKLARSDVYILNVLKCRPPGNRAPAPDEAANCRGFLERQLALLEPEFICCLGSVAAQNLLQTTTPIGRMRGKFHPLGRIQVLCTYHPAYLLRNPAAKRDVWEDMKLLLQAMGTPLE